MSKNLIGKMTFRIVVIIFMTSCSANSPSGGTCERKCGSRVIGGGNLTAVPLSNEFSLKCSPASAATSTTTTDASGNKTTVSTAAVPAQSLGSFEFNFLVYEDRTASNKASTGTGSTDSSSTQAAPAALTPDRVPMAGISFTPMISGFTVTGSDNKLVDTPASDWCTDSCGIATVKVSPLCAEQDMSIGILVPGLTGASTAATGNPNAAVKLSISKP